MNPNMIGAYGPWAAGLEGDGPARLSFRNPRFSDLDSWREQARARFRERLLQPDAGGVPEAELQDESIDDGLQIERLRWQLPFGPPTEAYFLKPVDARGPLPAVLAFHDHGGDKYFGARKIVRSGPTSHPVLDAHQATYYGGVAWANALASRGYAVLVPDAFAFASRRVRVADLSPIVSGGFEEEESESPAEVARYNRLMGDHEHLMAKSLFCAGTTWPGVCTVEDERALDYLCSRPDVDPQRVGCGGLSGGGLRTVYLAGLDDRIRCACCVGMMTTWRDFLLNTCHAHTWMIYLPGMPRELDYPEILGLRVPLPTLVLNNVGDALFTLPEMRRADRILHEVYQKAGRDDHYRGSWHAGEHKFDRAMQEEAFAWFDRWLKHEH